MFRGFQREVGDLGMEKVILWDFPCQRGANYVEPRELALFNVHISSLLSLYYGIAEIRFGLL